MGGWLWGMVVLFAIFWSWCDIPEESVFAFETVLYDCNISSIIEKIGERVPFRIQKLAENPIQLSFSSLQHILVNNGFIMKNCKNSTEGLFTLWGPNTEFPDSTIHGISSKSYTTQNISSLDFFSSIHNDWNSEISKRKRGQYYLYHTSPLQELPEDMRHELSGFRDFFLNAFDLPEDMTIDEARYNSQATLWQGSGGVIANCHYDRSHNVFIQLIGQKKWTLYPPTDWNALYLFPSVHPSYHQSQVGNIEHVNKTLFPMFKKTTKPFSIVLETGDMIYVPPYWFHQVETLGNFSASLSIVSPSKEEFISSRALWESTLLWNSQVSNYMRFKITKFVIQYLIESVYSREKLYDTYGAHEMTYRDRLNTLLLYSRLLHFSEGEGKIATCKQLEEILFTEREHSPVDTDDIISKIDRIVQKITSLPAGVREINVANVVEVVSLEQ